MYSNKFMYVGKQNPLIYQTVGIIEIIPKENMVLFLPDNMKKQELNAFRVFPRNLSRMSLEEVETYERNE